MKTSLKILLSLVISISTIDKLFAQDNEMDLLNDIVEIPTSYTFATFKSTRIINGQSIETISRNHLDFRISHRFGKLNQGFYDIFGLDNATIRFGLEYGILDQLTIGIGRSTLEKTYDGFIKYKILHQSSGKKTMPVTLTLFGSAAINTLKWRDENRENLFSSRMTYTAQVLIARKFNDWFSLQLTPTWIHRNLVLRANDENDVFALGIGARLKLKVLIPI